MIKAVLFDCFGVFYVNPVLAIVHDPATTRETARALHDLNTQAAYGLLDKNGFIGQAAVLLGMSRAAAEQYFFHGHVRNQALLDYAESLRPARKLGLLTNLGADMMDSFFAPDERRQLFDAVILSGEAGIAKPEPAVFQLACDRLGVTPREAVMIDDTPANCAGAERAGLQAIVYRGVAPLRQELGALLAGKAATG